MFVLYSHLERQRLFSRNTFGPGPRTQGVIDHIRKELIEIESAPFDLKEWIDVILLAFDEALRAGYYPSEIIEALEAKQTENEGRSWPDWRTADPNKAIEHKRSTPTETPAVADSEASPLDDLGRPDAGPFAASEALSAPAYPLPPAAVEYHDAIPSKARRGR